MALDYAKAYQQFIDEELSSVSMTQWMTAGEGQIRYDGGKDIEISELQTTGLGSYDATKTDGSAYPQGAVTNTWTPYTLAMDRGVKFALDRTDPADTNFIATAENVMREFARTQLTKEQDTYRINKIYKTVEGSSLAGTNVLTGTVTTENAVSELLKTLSAAQKSSEMLSGFVAIISQDHKNAFLQASNQTLSTVTFGNRVEINGVEYDNVMMFNDLPCLFAPQARMQTEITVGTGRDEDEAGVAASEGSKNINFVVASYDSVLAVSKIDSLKQVPPEENQLFDGTAIQARYLYDLFVPKNKVCAIAVHTEA